MHSAAAMVTLTSLFSLSQEAGGSGIGTGLEPRLGTSAMPISYPLIVPGWLLQLQPSQLCQGKKKGGPGMCHLHLSLFPEYQNFTPKCHCSLMLTSYQPEVANRSCKRCKRFSTLYIGTRQG